MGKVSYSAVVLDDKSRDMLIQKYKSLVPEGWDIICHHMTINMGELNDSMKDDIGKEVKLVVHSFGIDKLVLAFGVLGYPTKNKIPHITFAVNRRDGGKPVMSNKITNWKKISDIVVTGVVTEI